MIPYMYFAVCVYRALTCNVIRYELNEGLARETARVKEQKGGRGARAAGRGEKGGGYCVSLFRGLH